MCTIHPSRKRSLRFVLIPIQRKHKEKWRETETVVERCQAKSLNLNSAAAVGLLLLNCGDIPWRRDAMLTLHLGAFLPSYRCVCVSVSVCVCVNTE